MAAQDDDDSNQRRRGIQSIEIGMRILDALARSEGPAPLSAIAQAAGMAAPQVHRYLQSLIASGMARQEPGSSRYDLGPAALRIGLAALARTDVFKVVDRVIDEFVDRSGQAVQIAALGPTGPTVVRIYNGRPPLLTTLHVGAVLPLLTSATGRVFLAFVPASETSVLVESEQRTYPALSVTIPELRDSIRARGHSVETGTVIPGLNATAFPIFDLQGRALLVATALVTEATAPSRADAVKELGELCRQISSDLGWLPDKHV